MDEIKKMDGKSLDLTNENIEILKKLFPEVVTEGKIDFEKLRVILGDEIEKSDEKYEFTWYGKTNAVRLSQTPSMGTLRPDKGSSKNWDTTGNLYIEGDNLEVLKLLQKAYFGKIKMIYIDPPYNTGNDFVYKDDFRDNIKNYKEMTHQTSQANTETNGRFHTDWLNMMYPRLKLARNLLREDGIIFISIDDNEEANLKKICDEVFGENNFIGNIIWNSTKSVTNTALISVSHTYNLVYCKEIDFYIKNREKFRFKEDGEGFINPDNDPRGPWKADPFQVGGWRPNQQYEIVNPKTGVVYRPNPGCSWKNDYKKFKELLADNRIVFGLTGEGAPMRKRFMYEAIERGKVAKTLWTEIETTTNGTQLLKKLFDNKIIFENPKPVELIEKMLELGTYGDEDIILDFFSGSATTAHSVIKFNAENNKKLKFILVQLPENTDEKSEAYKAGYKNICEIGKERIRRAGDKIVEETGKTDLDIGFKVFKLDDSNIKTWDPDYSNENTVQYLLDMVNNIKEDRAKEDVLFEILLKLGFELTTAIEEIEVNKHKIYNVAKGALLVCLEDEISKDILDEIPKHKSEFVETRVVFRDNAFQSDADKLNAIQNLKQQGIIDVRSI
ncbi:site-specific DNA-methyltransferase [Deferribacterales bacterium Es71-Z0220]|uniref:site-specific DNA-methyltransferase n=1 Tax=Deferrivibrio essentukiensis TaxID=2880922 RepID=UPI001F616BE7|nr:site-specific DNA-methyltransferase [Deferrivibrio essentukiensis]MCB4204548.1 site-specific DNA-methyltransferase [Deferrivibrio essentukiensis]